MATAAVTLPVRKRRPRPGERAGGRARVPDIYFVKRIDNSRLRREVDPEKRRECYSLLGLCVLVFIFGLLFAWQHFQCVRYGYQIANLERERGALQEWNRELRLEQASLVEPRRIDTLARETLGLAPPGPRQLIRVGSASGVPASDVEFARSLPLASPILTADGVRPPP